MTDDEPVWTEGVCSDGAALLRNGEMVPISEILDFLNWAETARAAARLEAFEEAAQIAADNDPDLVDVPRLIRERARQCTETM